MLRIGTAGWSYEDWNQTVYPDGVKRPLEFMARFFHTVEINVTFYRPPTIRMAESWLEQVKSNPDFKFSLKAYRAWTHGNSPGESHESYLDVLELFREKGRLGGILFQFPWNYDYSRDHLVYLEEMVRPFKSFPVVIEIRHRSFERRDFFSFLADRGLALANIDQPLLGKAMVPSAIVTAPPGYVRLHGRNYRHWIRHDFPWQRYNYLYNPDELQQWKKRIDILLKQTPDVYVIANNHYRGQAVVNSIELMDLYGQKPADIPEVLKETYPERL